MNKEEKNRTKSFKRNATFKEFLTKINHNMYEAEKKVLESPIIFIMGSLRSGSTLITQWLSNSIEKSFSVTRKEVTDEKIINANRRFES